MNSLLHTYVELPLLAQLFLKGGVVVAVAMAIDLGLRRMHPALRVAAFRAAAAALVALPILAALPSPLVFSAGASEPPAPTAFAAEPGMWQIPEPSSPSYNPGALARVDVGEPILGPERAYARESQFVEEPAAPSALLGILLGIVYTMGLAVGLLALLRERREVALLLEESQPMADKGTLAEAAAFAAGLTLGAAPPIVQHEGLTTPMVVGARRAVVVMPTGLGAGDRRAALAHELAHVKGNDVRWTLAFAILRAVLWFHPLVWLLAARHRVAMEQVADFQAAGLLGDREDYARSLARVALRAALTGNALPACAGISMARRAEVTDRIHRVRTWDGRVPATLAVRLTAGGSLILLLGAASARLEAEETPAPDLTEVPVATLMATETPEAKSPPLEAPPEGMVMPDAKSLPREASAPPKPLPPKAPMAPPLAPELEDGMVPDREALRREAEGVREEARKIAEKARKEAREAIKAAELPRPAPPIREGLDPVKERELLLAKAEELKRLSEELGKQAAEVEARLGSREALAPGAEIDEADVEGKALKAAGEELERHKAELRELARQPGGFTFGVEHDPDRALEFAEKNAEGFGKVLLNDEKRERLIAELVEGAKKVPTCKPMDDAARQAMVRGIADKVIRRRIEEALAVRQPVVEQALTADIRARVEKAIETSCLNTERKVAAEKDAALPAAELVARLKNPAADEKADATAPAAWEALNLKATTDGPGVAAAVLPLVADKSIDRWPMNLVRTLGKTRDASVRAALNDYLLYSPSAEIRAEAARALGAQLPEREVVKMLRDALASEWDGQVQRAIRGALEGGTPR